MRPPFNNKPNDCITIEGKPHFIARDCAVVAEVFLYSIQSKSWFVLLGKRGSNVPDFQGFWGFPCGYLDWNETLYQAVLREIWEETGLILADLPTSEHVTKSQNLPSDHATNSMPWKISDAPYKNKKQNISHHFSFFIQWQSDALPPLTIEHAEVNEAEAAEWVVLDKAKQMEMAFNHTNCLTELLNTQAHYFDQIANLK